MRLTLVLFLLLFFVQDAISQFAFPIKVNNRWGLMDADGQVILEPNYEAIGEFKSFGYAVMQRDGRVGLLNNKGTEIILPIYEDLKVLDSTLVAVMEADEWMVINLKGDIILDKGYERVQVWSGGILGYRKENKWGVIRIDGTSVCSPKYDAITLKEEGYFQTQIGDQFGLLTSEGQVILKPFCDKINIYSDNLFFYQVDRLWGAVNRKGKNLIPANYKHYKKISENFLLLQRKKQNYLYSIVVEKIVTNGEYDYYYPFSLTKIICKNDRLLGLLDEEGKELLPVSFNEIQPFNQNNYRVKFEDRWGVVSDHLTNLIPLEYDYIAPPKGNVCVVKKGYFFGVLNVIGEITVPIEYQKIELFADKAHAYKGDALSIFHFDENGARVEKSAFKKHFTITIGKKKTALTQNRLSWDDENQYLLDNFEWFYSSREDKWGLRRLANGEVQIKPSFDEIRVEKDHGLTIVGIEKFEYYDFERTSYRFTMAYGVVNNDVGLLVSEVNLWDIRMEDFDKGQNIARCVFTNGRHGLISKNPVGLFLKKDYAYIGEFNDGIARISIKGKLSGSIKSKNYNLENLQGYLSKLIATNYMVDYTLYDQEFESDAQLICEGCEFGYIDTAGQVLVQPQYTFARNFVNDVGIVEQRKKFGLVNRDGMELIPCEYDAMHFLENTDDRILRVYTNRLKYGLIDTLGQVTVNLVYDDLGAFREGRLAVRRNGLWGFVDKNGIEVIPCRFRKVKDFSEGLASVKLGRKWGFIDQQGRTVVDFKYRDLGHFNDGLAWASTHKGMGYINTKGEMVIPAKFDKAADFEKNVARVVVEGQHGLINKEGDYFLRPLYSNIDPFNEHGVAVSRFGKNSIRYGLITRTGDLITIQRYKSIGPFKDGLAAVKYKNGYGFINCKGQMVIDNKYDKVSNFSEGLAVVQKNGVCGYVNRKGEEVVNLEYSKCLDFEDGRAVIYKGYRRGGVIDTLGNYVIEPSINRLLNSSNGKVLVRDNSYRFYYITEETGLYNGYYQKAGEFQHGVAAVKSDDHWGIINQRGIEIIPPKYDKIGKFQDGYAIVKIKQFSGLSNLEGEAIIQPEYEYISYAGKGLFRVEQGDKIGYFNASGSWVWDLRK